MIIKINSSGAVEFHSFDSESLYSLNDIIVLVPKDKIEDISEIKNRYTITFTNIDDETETAVFNLLVRSYNYADSPNYYQCELLPTATALLGQGSYSVKITGNFYIRSITKKIQLVDYKFSKPNSFELSIARKDYQIYPADSIIEITLDRMFQDIDLASCDVIVKTITTDNIKAIEYINYIDVQSKTIRFSWRGTPNGLFAICFLNPQYDAIAETGIFSWVDDSLIKVTSAFDNELYLEFTRWMNSKEFYLLQGAFELRDLEKAITITKRHINMNENENYIVKDDHNSQLVTFKIDRFQDAIDISKKKIYIKFINADGEGYLSKAVNIIKDEEYVYFSWLITSQVTTQEGFVNFNIDITGENTSQDNWYKWQTSPASIQVLPTLSIQGEEEFKNDNITQNMPDWYINLLDQMEVIKLQNSIHWKTI